MYQKCRQMKSTKKKNSPLAYRVDNALNAICPYFTMFPLEYPLRALKRHKSENPIILDPFCGRGTTLYAARRMDLQAWGIDASPVAAAIAKAKLASCDYEAPIELARKMLLESEAKHIPTGAFFKKAYHASTLKDICTIRESLLSLKEDSDAAVILRAAMLGCLHGPLPKKIDNAGYFSNQMPRTYAAKPDYAVRFWKKHGMVAPKIDIVEVLSRKIHRLVGLPDENNNITTQVLCADSQNKRAYKSIDAAPDIVITSPPYYGMRTYLQDQWLRNWFLGGPEEIDYSSGNQLDHGGPEKFAKSLGKVWKNVGEIGSDDLHMYVRFGIIPSVKVDAKKIFMDSLKQSGIDWRLISVRPAKTAHAGKRQATQMKASSSAAIEYDFHVARA